MMKKITVAFFLLILLITPVKAANYQLRELIPVDVSTTIVTDNFSYQDFYYNNNELEAEALRNNFIIFKNIKNLTDKDLPVSISIGLFDAKKENIGIINYCSTNDKTSAVAETVLKSKEEKSYVIEVNKKYLAPKTTVEDIKYIAVLSDNINCRTKGSLDYVGERVENIGKFKRDYLGDDAKLLVIIVEVIALAIFLVFLYKFLFTNAFRNFDGKDIRQEYARINKELKEKRENALPKPKKPVEESKKNSKIIEQEHTEDNKKNSEQTDLHNLYK